MLTITDVAEIMRLAGAVHESTRHPLNHSIDDFKPVKDPHNTKRYLLFSADGLHTSYTHELKKRLEKLGNGEAVFTLKAPKIGNIFRNDARQGTLDIIFVDTDKITDSTESQILSELVANTMIKMDQSALDIEVRNLTSENHRLKKQLEMAEWDVDKRQAALSKMKEGIDKIKKASKNAKAGLGSRKVNALKDVIEKVTENTK